MKVECIKKRTANRKSLMFLSLGVLLWCAFPVMGAAVGVSGLSEATDEQERVAATGVVRDAASGEPIIGASVVEKGTSNGVITDVDARFTLNVTAGSVLQVSYVGYETQEVTVTDGRPILINLRENTELLDEVVVVGYGTQKKANLTGAVSTVDVSKTLDAKPQMDVAKALQGVVPGLTVLNTQGGIDEQPTLTIRGVGTLSNSATSDPLIIVDGVPMDNLALINPQDIASVSVLKDAASTSIYGSRAAFGVILITTKQGTKTEKLSINYSNNFAWSTPTMLPDYPDVPSQLRALISVNERMGADPELFGMYLDEMLPYAEAWYQQNGGRKKGYGEMRLYQSDSDVGDYFISSSGIGYYYADWDVVGIMYRDWTPSQSHNVNVQGTTGRTTYYMSFGYDKKEGVLNFNTDQLHRYNANVNITTDLTDWLQVGARMSYTNRKYTQPETRRNTYQYIWRWGSFFEPMGTIDGVDMRNAIAYLKQAGDNETTTNYTRMTGFLKAKIIKGLTLNADYTYNATNVFQDAVGLPVSGYNSWSSITDVSDFSSDSYLQQSSYYTNAYALNVYANYEFSVGGNHNFNVMLGANAEGEEYFYHTSYRTGLLNSDQPEFSLATGDTQTVSGGHTHSATAGYFGRINYNWNDIWLLELNGRFDGSSSFPAADRWGFFPSGSAGYRFSQEGYFDGIRDVWSNGKLRVSYGEIGNEAVGSNMFVSTISSVTSYWLDSTGSAMMTMYGMPTLVSSTLTWERIRTFDVGLDVGFLNNEINASFDWYQRNTLDMLAPSVTLPDVLGTDAPYVNGGSLQTRGWELSVSWNHRFGDVDVYVNGNVGDYKTVVTEYNNPTGILSSYFTGQVYGDIYGFVTDRLFTTEDFVYDANGNIEGYAEGVADQSALESGSFTYGVGDVKFVDLNGDGVIDGGSGTIDDMGDLTVIGNTTPRYQYGFRLGAAWKGLDIDMYFQGVGKWDVWSYGDFVLTFARGADGIYAHQLDYWTEDNLDAFYPRLYAGHAASGTVSGISTGRYNFYPQTRYLIDRSYLRFKNLTVGYTIPQSLTRRWYIDKLRVYFTAENLCELINNSYVPIDPEMDDSDTGSFSNGVWGRVSPIMRTLSFGIQISF